VVSSENPYKIVVFSARELLLPENFKAWETCQDGYQVSVMGDRDRAIQANGERVRCDHLFSAEKNALTLETRVASNDNLRRRLRIQGLMPTLSPRIVHLLEHQDRLINMLKAWMLGWINKEDTGNGVIWQLNAPHIGVVDICSERADKKEDMLSVMARFVFASNLRNLSHGDLHEEVQDAWETWKRDIERGLLDSIAFERAMCDLIGELDRDIRRLIRAGNVVSTLDANNFEATCVDQARKYMESQNPSDKVRERIQRYLDDPSRNLPLAHQVLSDLSRLDQNSLPLVTDIEAHLQFVNIVLRLLLTDLHTEVDQYQRQARRRA
jgi:hypothetical protein